MFSHSYNYSKNIFKFLLFNIIIYQIIITFGMMCHPAKKYLTTSTKRAIGSSIVVILYKNITIR